MKNIKIIKTIIAIGLLVSIIFIFGGLAQLAQQIENDGLRLIANGAILLAFFLFWAAVYADDIKKLSEKTE